MLDETHPRSYRQLGKIPDRQIQTEENSETGILPKNFISNMMFKIKHIKYIMHTQMKLL